VVRLSSGLARRGHRRFVRTAFLGLLGREPDPQGLADFVRDLSDGTRTREEVLRTIAGSAEAASRLLRGPGIREHVRHVGSFRPRGEGAPRPVVFLHIMKCGGTSLAEGLAYLASPWPMLINAYVDELTCLPQPMLQQAMLVTGHLPYGAVDLLAPDAAVLTVLREPVSRTLSHFTHVRANGHDDLTLEEFVGADAWRQVWQDHQAKQLAADVPVEAAWRGDHAGPDLQELLTSWSAGADADPGALLESASRRLAAIDIVGVTDDLTAVLRQVAALWGKPEPSPVGEANVSARPVTRDAVPAPLAQEIVRGTIVDAALYEQARERAHVAGRDDRPR
jgi:hypothetical protein